jgi:hypothetical protein
MLCSVCFFTLGAWLRVAHLGAAAAARSACSSTVMWLSTHFPFHVRVGVKGGGEKLSPWTRAGMKEAAKVRLCVSGSLPKKGSTHACAFKRAVSVLPQRKGLY